MRLHIALAIACTGCAGVPFARTMAPRDPSGIRADVVRTVRELVGRRSFDRMVPADCSGLPAAAYAENGILLAARSTEELFRDLASNGHTFDGRAPQAGDLVFIRDRAGPGRLHVGVIGRVGASGTLLVYERMAHGVEAYRMNPAHPHDARDPADHQLWNDSLADGRGGRAPAGSLFYAYASVLP